MLTLIIFCYYDSTEGADSDWTLNNTHHWSCQSVIKRSFSKVGPPTFKDVSSERKETRDCY